MNGLISPAYTQSMKDSMFDARDAAGFHRRFILRPEIIGYLGPAVLFAAITVLIAESVSAAFWPMVAMVVLYPVAEHVLHRYLLHGNFLAKSSVTSPLWYRI
ncbi:MAG TPA: hypothetical protein VET25_02400, partial [Aestuariivirgaceae bacterium]|nr:hypothetical protein [Aestuariivirgaceae bacterium]